MVTEYSVTEYSIKVMQKIDVLETEQYIFYISLSIVLVSIKPQDTTMLCPFAPRPESSGIHRENFSGHRHTLQ